jgi:hypothetical protein
MIDEKKQWLYKMARYKFIKQVGGWVDVKSKSMDCFKKPPFQINF